MHRPLVALHIYDSVSTALDAAREHGVHHFPVCKHEQLVGMVCTCDLQEAELEQAVGNLMRPAVTISDRGSAEDAAQLMKAADVGSVLVTDQRGAPCGIVTRSDLSGEPPAAALLEDCRCESCGTIHHLHRHGVRLLCFSCRERADEPQAFEGGGGD
ncbi:MAG TPA: CBS domain-containing protein [Polyangiaceae bacterium]|nr:CBS domain-containing protein [Polyangiaceae bacterium]